MNSSATGGYVQPIGKPQLPKGLNLRQFLQTVLVGVSGFPAALVRPDWQPNPPKNPPLETNWLAYGGTLHKPDAYGFSGVNPDGSNYTQRHQTVEVQCSIYGPDAESNYDLISDGFLVQNNLAALKSANMGFTEMTQGNHIPDLVNERWIDRIVTSVILRREIQRQYPILTFLSAAGVIDASTSDLVVAVDWSVTS